MTVGTGPVTGPPWTEPPRRGRPAGKYAAIVAGVVALAVVIAAVVIVLTRSRGTTHVPRAAASSIPAQSADPVPTPATPTPTPKPTSAALTKAARKRLTAAIADYLDGASLSVSIKDLTTGRSYDYHPAEQFGTASIVKVDILSTLLLKAQKAGRKLTATEKATATQMIEYSDNKAADALWNEVGGGPGVAAANKKFGLKHTIMGPGGYWGTTETTSADQLRLLSTLSSSKSPLTTASRSYILGLMRNVTSSQRWGISAGAKSGDTVANKNGWLPRKPDDLLWAVNSIGRITGGGHDFLIAVLSQHSTTMGAGITKVQHVAAMVTKVLRS